MSAEAAVTAGSPARRVVIAGGGVAALEALLALRALAGDAVAVTVIAPDERFRLRALTVAEPFSAGHADLGSFPGIVRREGADVRRTEMTGVDVARRVVACADGEEVEYDSLILAPGARPRAVLEPALTFGLGDPLALPGLLADLEQGYVGSVAFVVPDDVAWPLPLYELALLTAAEVRGMGERPRLAVVTPEPAPLAVFGAEASAAVAALLGEAGVEVHAGAPATVQRGRVLRTGVDEPLEVDRVVALPVLDGPRVPGVPADDRGFIPVDARMRVRALDDVYAIGDATDFLVKQGGLACQQADVAAAHVARAAGADVAAEPIAPVLRGRLLTGGTDRFLQRDLGEAHGEAGAEPLWWPPAKVAGRYLGPWLEQRGAAPAASEPPADGIEVTVALSAPG